MDEGTPIHVEDVSNIPSAVTVVDSDNSVSESNRKTSINVEDEVVSEEVAGSIQEDDDTTKKNTSNIVEVVVADSSSPGITTTVMQVSVMMLIS